MARANPPDSVIPAHPLADLFPMLSLADADALRLDIVENGLRERIVILDEQILDGRNRYRAAVGAGVIFGDLPADGSDLWISHFRRFNPAQDGDALAFVLSKNKFRRHMTPGQLGLLAADIANLKAGRPKAATMPNSTETPPIGGVSLEAASEMVGAKLRNAERGAVVRDHGTPELVEKVRSGEVTVSAAADLATLPVGEQLRILRESHPREFRRAVKEHRGEVQAEKKERRQDREAELGARQTALPDKRYGVILADPEWQFRPYGVETGMDRAADNHYPTSTLDVIKSRPIGDIAADDAILALWVTVPMLLEGIAVMAAWGFSYKSHFVGVKDRIGTGYWNRNKHELLLIGTRGNVPAPAMGDQFESVFEFAVGAHSAKPDFAHRLAEAYFPNLPKIELNARTRRLGWDAWGLEAPGDIHRASEQIAVSKAEALEIIRARYTGDNGQQLADEIGRPIATIRKWAWEIGASNWARNVARVQDINSRRESAS